MKRAKHNLSNYNLFTGDMGKLYPIGLTEVIPGDSFQHSTSLLIRFSPMVAPVMHPITVRVHHFFVPNRLVWDGWENFITAGPDGNDQSAIPTLTNADSNYTLLDYLGVRGGPQIQINALPVYAYNLIFNEYYRDQDLQAEALPGDILVRNVGWEKDYFTTARPWTQKGPEITLPLGDTAPILSDGGIMTMRGLTTGDPHQMRVTSDDHFVTNTNVTTPEDVQYESGLIADLSGATPVNVNDFRRAFALQRYAEARARYGSRYTEYLRYLGIKPSDARLQRPEYLGGGKVNVSISEVLQTAPDNEGQGTEYGVGDLYGHGIAAMRSNRYRKFFEEHGYVISLMSARPKSIYTDGMDRTWLKQNREDFFQRELVHIGQQPVYNNEVFASAGNGDEVFGYQDRYDEYRTGRSRTTGEFRDLLNYWHLGRQFEQTPVLNDSFIKCDPSKRIFAEQTQHSLWCMAQHRLVARRLVPKRAMSRII